MEGSGYSGDYVLDYMCFEDEVKIFRSVQDVVAKKKNYRGMFGCTRKEAGQLKDQEADGIIGLGVSTNRTIFSLLRFLPT